MPELEPLNAEASASMPIPPPATRGQEEEAAPGDSSWWMDRRFNKKCCEYEADLVKFEDEWKEKWNPLKLKHTVHSVNAQPSTADIGATEATCCLFSSLSEQRRFLNDFKNSCLMQYLRNPLTPLMWYARFRHYLRDTSLLLCFLAIMGLPWNRPAQGFYDASQLDEEDQWMRKQQYASDERPYVFFGLCIAITFSLSFITSPVPSLFTNDHWDALSGKSSRMTFLRMILFVEKTRESKATKRWGYIAHGLSIIAYSFFYAMSYIQTSCFEKHYSNSKEDATRFALDKILVKYLSRLRSDAVAEGRALRQHVIPCVGKYGTVFTLSEIQLNSTDGGSQWFALNNDAVRPDSLSFWIIVLVYFAKVIVDVFFYDDIYNHTMLPYAEFAAKHCPDEFNFCKDALIKRK